MTDPISSATAARYLCERSGWTLTNLKLQKMLYLAQMIYMGEHDGARLIDSTFQAWDFGPVLPEIYGQVRTFGSGAIQDVFRFFGSSSISEDQKKTLDGVYDQLKGKTAGQLVSITHWPGGAWAASYIPGIRGIPISDPSILNEYKDRLARQQPKP